MTSPRHCWVQLPFHVGEYPGLILEWQDATTDAGVPVRRFLVTYVREDEGRWFTQWVASEQVRPAAG